MRIYSIKPKFQKLLNKDKEVLIKWGVGPTAINILALLVSVVAGLAFYYSNQNIIFLAVIPFLAYIRIAFNALDGMVAREIKAKNQQFGEVLNEFVDRLSDVAFFGGLAFVSFVNPVLVLSALICILLVSYVGIVGKSAGGSRQYVGLMGKADRMFWLSVACVGVLVFQNVAIMTWFLWFVLTLSIITIIQRFGAIKAELYSEKKTKKKR
jgi:CDP-diacylglycerol--glycerol-3-phosphate 3-phosphatidyltransferase